MADYNSSGLILNQSELQSNGLNTPPNLYMSTGVGGGKRKSQKRIKKGGDCGCNKSLIKGGKKQRKTKSSKKGGKKQTKSKKTKSGKNCPPW
jgi:hypothetical protein